jgi:hypothetical protein
LIPGDDTPESKRYDTTHTGAGIIFEPGSDDDMDDDDPDDDLDFWEKVVPPLWPPMHGRRWVSIWAVSFAYVIDIPETNFFDFARGPSYKLAI